jgi:GNAT superfamily N-acetyltransferase
VQISLKVVPLERVHENQFFDFLDRDRILHIFTIYDLKFMKEKTRVWLAFQDREICGYLFEFDKRIVHTHGTVRSVTRLLDFIDLKELTFVIEPNHLTLVTKFYEPIEPTDQTTRGKITKYLVMKTNAQTFIPSVRHPVKRLDRQALQQVLEDLGEDWKKRIEDALSRGLAFGAYHDDRLASVATVTEIVGDLALIRGVCTVPSLRRKGLATSACSVLIEELIGLGKKAVLWVATDNLPARRVYQKIGFLKTGKNLLGFKAKRI